MMRLTACRSIQRGFDMAGNAQLRAAIHHQLGDLIAHSGTVGATH